ncbi:uncharacterized protein LOC134531005 isoform X2 [Bacillus rossius redtenbacheri]|uniref:uncharacterized protein LOC134531005 isoform X2 n=1 Tax=Bacillus rossius redtenbacheri TaxID=93214 RepID=UPI002FDD1105
METSDTGRRRRRPPTDKSCYLLSVEQQFTLLVTDGAQVPVDTATRLELPPWFDSDKFNLGKQYFQQNYYAMFVSKLSGLLAILAVPSILRVLVLTERSSEPAAAFRRYLSTLSHMLRWYGGDPARGDSSTQRSLAAVRTKHCAAGRRAAAASLGHISQLDMALTQFGFMGFSALQPARLGLVGSEHHVAGFLHFWRTIGYVMGIDDRFNICRESVLETRMLCRMLSERVLGPALASPPPQFDAMSHALLHAMWAVVPVIDHAAFCDFTRLLAGLDPVHTCGTVSTPHQMYSRALLSFQLFVQEVLLRVPIVSVLIRLLLNLQMWFSIFMAQRLPLLAYLAFGRARIAASGS